MLLTQLNLSLSILKTPMIRILRPTPRTREATNSGPAMSGFGRGLRDGLGATGFVDITQHLIDVIERPGRHATSRPGREGPIQPAVLLGPGFESGSETVIVPNQRSDQLVCSRALSRIALENALALSRSCSPIA